MCGLQVRALSAALAPDGLIIANLWHGTPAARSEADAFARTVVEASGTAAYALRVAGHEKNRILLAVRSSDGPTGGKQQGAIQQALARAAAAHAARGTEPALVETMRSNAATLTAWHVE